MEKLKQLTKSPKVRLGLVAALALFSLYRLLSGGEPSVVALKGEPVANYQVAAETSGRIQPLSEVFVSVKRGGRLDRVLVQPGTQVAKDQLIAIIDESFHTSAVQSALSNYRLAATDLGRLQGLFRSSAATAQELDTARNAVAVRRSELEQARQKLEDGLVRAPVAGILSILPFALGETLPDGARVAVIEDRSSYRLRAVLPLAAQQYLSQKVPVGFWKYGTAKPELDQLLQVECEIIQTPVAQSVGSGEMDVELHIAALPEQLKSGDLVNIRLPLRTIEQATRVPAIAVQNDGAKSYILTVDKKNRLHKNDVQVIETAGDTALVTGIEGNNDRIVAPLLPAKVREAIAKNKSVKVKA